MEGRGISRDARLLMFESYLYCAEASTDGHIRAALSRICDSPDPAAAADELTKTGFWESTEEGYFVQSFLNDNLEANYVELLRENAVERKRRNRLHKVGDHSICIKGNFCPAGEIEHKSKSSAMSRDKNVNVTSNQSKAKQVNNEAEALITKQGATPDAPKGALGFAPNGGLVISDGLENWPHPHIRVDSMACVICGMEHARGRHFPTNKTQEVSYVVDYLNKAKIGTEISYEIDQSSNLISIVLGAFFENVKVEFRCGSQDLDAKLTEDLVVTSLRIWLPTPPSFSEWPNNTRNLWLQPVRALAESINAEQCGFYLRRADPSDQTSKITGCELFIGDTQGIGYCMESIEEIMNAIQELSDTKPEQPDVNLPAPTEANTETNGEKND